MNSFTKRFPQRGRKQLKFWYSLRGHLPLRSELTCLPLLPWNIRKTPGVLEANKLRNASVTEGIYCLIIAAFEVCVDEILF